MRYLKISKAIILILTVASMCFIMSGCGENSSASKGQTEQRKEISSGESAVVSESVKKTPIEQAQDEINKKGFHCKVVATTFGMSQDGFLAVDESDNKRIIAVDLKNNVIAAAYPHVSLSEFAMQTQEKYPSPLIVDFLIFDAVHDADDSSGVWQGKNHLLPIYGLYEVDNGNIIPGMLNTGNGAKPSHYHSFLKEQRNVDLMNMFLVQAIPLLNEAQRTGSSL